MMVHNGGYSFSVPNNGASGVDLFFVISGFIMIYSTSESFGDSGATMSFVRRRFVRVVPTYWIYTSVVVLLLVFAPGLFKSTVFDWRFTISSYLFLLFENSDGNIGTVLQTGWTLCYEFYFYLLFALLLNFARKYFLPICGGLFSIGYLLGITVEMPPWASVVTNPILFEFYLGAIIALVFIRGLYLPRPLAICTIVLGLCTILFFNTVSPGGWSRVVFWGLPGGAILLGALSLERLGLKTPPFLVALGGSSYSLYLVHPLLLPLMGKLWFKFSLALWLPPGVLLVTACAGAVTTGHIMYLVLEKPLIRWFSTQLKSEREQIVPASV